MDYDIQEAPGTPVIVDAPPPLTTLVFGAEPNMEQTPCDPFFGPMLGALRDNLAFEGSELGTGIFLFSLAVATRAKMILEVGRHRGFSTLAFASALKFNEMGWDEHAHNKQRPDIDYAKHEARTPGHLFSIDIAANPAAEALIEKHGLTKYVHYINHDSKQCKPTDVYDIMLIDGDHTFEGCTADMQNFIPFLKPGGYFILHDYYGWFLNGKNCSPIMQVIQKCCFEFDQVLIDTGYQSFVVFRKQQLQFPVLGHENMSSPGAPSPEQVVELNTSSDKYPTIPVTA
jgi:hypothetical protein